MSDWEKLRELYQNGLPLSAEDRDHFLQKHCGGQPEMQYELLSLWENSDEEDPIINFKSLPEKVMSAFLENSRETHKATNYRILETLGQGGMGTVYKAEQQKPFRRTVALKVLPVELSSQELQLRFRQEQEVLAMMAHPNVASVFDAGLTEQGRPFFTMEYLQGEPITSWCDKHKSSVEERLSLFRQVCAGLQHAHQKGVIHRDINPSNILVVTREGRPIPKIIDFGIARLIDRIDGLGTRQGAFMGTPGYMSPEQAVGLREEAIDTRVDVYALGVLLYELLTGVLPMEEAIAKAESFSELARIISDQHPPKPSRRIGTGTAGEGNIGARRSIHERVLRQTLAGDLDCITMKAISLDTRRRYATCASLSEDIQRFQLGLPVNAGPDSMFYHLKKMVQRRKHAFVTAFAMILALFVALPVTGWMYYRARTAEQDARQALARSEVLLEFTQGMFKEIDPFYQGRNVTAFSILEKAEKEIARKYRLQPDLEASIRMAIAQSYLNLGLLEEAETQYGLALDLKMELMGPNHRETLEVKERLGFAAAKQKNYRKALEFYEGNYKISANLLGSEDPLTLHLGGGLAHVLYKSDRLEEAEQLFQKVLDFQMGKPESKDYLATINNFANFLSQQGRFDEAERLHRQNLITREKKYGPNHLSVLSTKHNLGKTLQIKGRHAQAEPFYRQALNGRRTLLGSSHFDTVATLNNYAVLLGNLGRPEEAVALIQEGLSTLDALRLNHPAGLRLRHNLGHFQMIMERYDDAESTLKAVLSARMGHHRPGSRVILNTRATLAENFQRRGRPVEAVASLRDIVKTAANKWGQDHKRTAVYKVMLAQCLTDLGAYGESEDLSLECLSILREGDEYYLKAKENLEKLGELKDQG